MLSNSEDKQDIPNIPIPWQATHDELMTDAELHIC